ncbi:MAG: hypothetical protein HOO99_12645 [Hyphomicrobiaceae bacterium]|nr:hypothetical protein [Hyphomicrobiaceae bacterium]
MAIFERTPQGHWTPSTLAAGPFAGLQGGAVAGLLAAEVEAAAAKRQWGTAISVSAWFLRPVPMAELRTEMHAIREGGRISVVDNTVWLDGDPEACATVRVTLIRNRAIEVPGYVAPEPVTTDPTHFAQVARRVAPHGKPWFMDAMEVRAERDTVWFRLREDLVAGVGALSRVLGPADWAHGLFRPVTNVVADPNPNLTVHLHRQPRGEWIGVRATTHWHPDHGVGSGKGLLFDIEGEIGAVSMAVVLTPFPKPLAT